MDADRFDAVIRRFSDPSRRALLGLTLGGGMASLLGLSEADAKKKKKKKKKCKGGTKKCGKKCIAATACCSSADCGGRACNNGTCSCPDGEFACGSTCVSGDACCEDNQCAAGQNCDDGFCRCPGSNAIACGESCCDGDDQVCRVDGGPATCQDGNCPASNYCNGSTRFFCANSPAGACVCASTTDPMTQTVCVDFSATVNPANCNACTTSANCPSGQFCIPGNSSPSGACGCSNNFCVPLCD